MTKHQPDGSIDKTVWQSQVLEAPQLSLDFVRHQADKLNTDLRHQQRAAVVVGLVCVILCVVYLILPPDAIPGPLEQLNALSAAMLVAAAGYIRMQWRRRTQILSFRAEEAVASSLSAYRRELERRRDLYLGSWRWSLWPLLLVAAVLLIGGLLYDPRPDKVLRYAVGTLLMAACAAIVRWINVWKAREFQRELEAVESIGKK
jgi:uncharacterized membrane protein